MAAGSCAGPGRQEGVDHPLADEAGGAEQPICPEQAVRADPLRSSQGLERGSQSHDGSTPFWPSEREVDPDMASPRVAHPVHGCADAQCVEDRAGCLGTLLERVVPTRIPAGPMAGPVMMTRRRSVASSLSTRAHDRESTKRLCHRTATGPAPSSRTASGPTRVSTVRRSRPRPEAEAGGPAPGWPGRQGRSTASLTRESRRRTSLAPRGHISDRTCAPHQDTSGQDPHGQDQRRREEHRLRGLRLYAGTDPEECCQHGPGGTDDGNQPNQTGSADSR